MLWLGVMGQYLVMDCNPKDTGSQLTEASEAKANKSKEPSKKVAEPISSALENQACLM